jgi:O-antigen ligase
VSLLAEAQRTASSGLRAWRAEAWPWTYEGLFFGYVAYTTGARLWGIAVENLGVAWLVGLALLAVPLRRDEWRDEAPVFLAGLTAAIYLFFQLWAFHLPPRNPLVQVFFSWPLIALVVQKCLRRPGFLQRLAVAMFALLLLMWPSHTYEMSSSGILQAALSGTRIDNPNDLAAWIGYCVLVFWLWSLQTTTWRHWLLWAAAVLALAMLAKTVSRSALGAVALTMLLSLRRLPRHRWLSTGLIIGGLLVLGVLILPFGQAAQAYSSRLLEHTGRFVIWPRVLRAFLARPLTGYGADQTLMYFASQGKYHTPHNGLLLIGMASGLLPLLPFVALWLGALLGALRPGQSAWPGDLDALPLLVYAGVMLMAFDVYFTMPWAVAVVGYCFWRPARVEAPRA